MEIKNYAIRLIENPRHVIGHKKEVVKDQPAVVIKKDKIWLNTWTPGRRTAFNSSGKKAGSTDRAVTPVPI